MSDGEEPTPVGGVRRKRYWVLALVVVGIGAWLVYDYLRIEATFESEPTGAVVRVDGRAYGLTPITVPLTAGRHRVELTHSHYEPEIIDLTLARGERIQRRVSLNPGRGTLSLLSNPKGAWVEIDDERIEGNTPMTLDLPSGPTVVRMGLKERRLQEKEVIVLAGQTIEVNLQLPIDPHGSLTVLVDPADARVRFPELDISYTPGVRVPIGEQLIEATRNGYEKQAIRFNVLYGDNLTRFKLSRAYGNLTINTTPPDAEISVTYEGAGGRQVSAAYSPGMRLPTGVLDVSARAMGYRTAFKRVDLGRAGAELALRLAAMDVEVGASFQDALADGGRGPLMIVVPPGEFVMGDPTGVPSVRPATKRLLAQPFGVSVYEITAAEYLAFADAVGRETDARLEPSEEPVRRVSWPEAVAYADWLSAQTGGRYRLPTEAEWEYLARAGTGSAFWFGDDEADLCRFANLADQSMKRVNRDWTVADCDDGFPALAPVGSFPPNAFGLHDVHGNVSEWVQECGIPPYAGAPRDGTIVNRGQNCRTNGVRGGAWDNQPEALRSARRGFAEGRSGGRGIRLVKEL
ncbi:MAG: SUMF1/EgtB/PvdO family nonheme iron enzyme [Pseudomonadota bacterium]